MGMMTLLKFPGDESDSLSSEDDDDDDDEGMS